LSLLNKITIYFFFFVESRNELILYHIVTHVLHMDTTIRNIDPFVYKKLKTKAAQEGISIGEAVTKAISEWLGLTKKKKRSIIDIEPEHFGYQYRNLSEEIDEVIYK